MVGPLASCTGLGGRGTGSRVDVKGDVWGLQVHRRLLTFDGNVIENDRIQERGAMGGEAVGWWVKCYEKCAVLWLYLRVGLAEAQRRNLLIKIL